MRRAGSSKYDPLLRGIDDGLVDGRVCAYSQMPTPQFLLAYKIGGPDGGVSSRRRPPASACSTSLRLNGLIFHSSLLPCFPALTEELQRSRPAEGNSEPVQTPLRIPRTRSQWYGRRQGTFRTTTYPAVHRRRRQITPYASAGRRQITPYANAASLSDSDDPASSASSSSSRPSVIVSRTADTE